MSESESDAFGDFCDALQEKYNMDHEDREKLVDLYKNQDGLVSKRAAQCASAVTTIKVLQKLHSKSTDVLAGGRENNGRPAK